MTAGVYRAPGLALGVEVDEPSVLEWLDEFLAPSFVAGAALHAAPDVRLVSGRGAFDALRARGPAPSGELVDCFALDQGLVRLPAWQGSPGERTVFDEALGAFYCREASGAVRVVAAEDSPTVRVAVMRVVRELTMCHLAARGWLVLHAAAFVTDGEAVLAVGPKRAGKTTLLSYALLGGAAHCLANDRVAVASTGEPPTAWGIPTIVSLRVAMLPRFPELASTLATGRYAFQFSRRELARGTCPVDRAPARVWSLAPEQYCELVGARLVASAPARAIVFPRLVDDATSISLQPLDAADAASRIAASVFRPHRRDALFVDRGDDGNPASDDEIRVRSAVLAAGAATYDCRVGGRVAAGDRAWLDALAAEARGRPAPSAARRPITS